MVKPVNTVELSDRLADIAAQQHPR